MRRTNNHRQIYEQYHGPIPKDSQGRSLEVHHINGNHSDNRIENLKLVTIEEHYAIHKAQGDYGACLIMSYRMGLSPEETSELSRKVQLERVKNGTHHWQGPTHNQRLVKEGLHPFLDKEAARQRNLKRVANGTHNLLSDANPSKLLAKAGKHHFQLDNPVNKALANGTHASKIKLSCIFCRKQCSKNNFNKQHSQCGTKILPAIE